ncbi:membrane protein insertion efficiency factor YidD [Achromobacter insolitus]|uniref:membrane protein insertion efficiency factor YidD n=1 Tax=Achromobacter insolitus TaxID=217204 RepID=UPI001EEF5010
MRSTTEADGGTRVIIGIYRRFAPARVRESCRFEPSCSEYCLQAVAKYGFWKGWRMTFDRLARCRPPAGGIDLP